MRVAHWMCLVSALLLTGCYDFLSLFMAVCKTDADCEAELECDEERGVCQKIKDHGDSSSTSSSDLSGGSSGSIVNSSSGAVADGGPDVCPQRCGELFPNGHVAQWRCAAAGKTAADCRVDTCQQGWANCDQEPNSCPDHLLSSKEHCGVCGRAADPAWGSGCMDGGFVCGSGPTCAVDAGQRCQPMMGADGGMAQCCPDPFQNCQGVCTDTRSSMQHCGWCFNDIRESPSATQCVNGQPVCGDLGMACPEQTPVCLVGSPSECRGCVDDGDCGTNTPVCCRGVCTAVEAACGCGKEPGAEVTFPCSASGVGNECIAADGTLLARGNSYLPGVTAAQLHDGICGCSTPNGRTVSNTMVCAMQGAFYDLCVANIDNPVIGHCAEQNNPVGTTTQGAGNCGQAQLTCDPSMGGLTCSAVSGVGKCTCETGATGDTSCKNEVEDTQGNKHVVADTCGATGCMCGTHPACNPDSDTPDCCAGTCTNVASDVNNCGQCDVRVADYSPRASGCSNGDVVCGTQWPCAAQDGGIQYCLASGTGFGCFQCASDDQCPGTDVCCRGTCVPIAGACGCGLEPNGREGETCSPSGVGGECVEEKSGLTIYSGGVQVDELMKKHVHGGKCGCKLIFDDPITNSVICTTNDGGFLPLCVPTMSDPNQPDGGVITYSDAGNVGLCGVQNNPAGTAYKPAENCGRIGRTCNAYLGGNYCTAVNGVGECSCESWECSATVRDHEQVVHQPASTCGVDKRCVCSGTHLDDGGYAEFICDPESTHADCCGYDGGVTKCVDIRNDPSNCGGCNVKCADGKECRGGVCTCSVYTQCEELDRKGGGTTCSTGGLCVCPDSAGLSCKPNETCWARPPEGETRSFPYGCCEPIQPVGYNSKMIRCVNDICLTGRTCFRGSQHAGGTVWGHGACCTE